MESKEKLIPQYDFNDNECIKNGSLGNSKVVAFSQGKTLVKNDKLTHIITINPKTKEWFAVKLPIDKELAEMVFSYLKKDTRKHEKQKK